VPKEGKFRMKKITVEELLRNMMNITNAFQFRIDQLEKSNESEVGWEVQGPTRTDEFLDFIADRLVNVYNESENVDYVLRLREMAALYRDR
jgi:hypothetical protein